MADVTNIQSRGEEYIPHGYDPDLYKIRHSAAHIMAQAVLEVFPDGKVAIGPPVDDGFYYDFDLPRALTPEDLQAIEDRMRQIIKGKFAFSYRVVSPAVAREMFKDQPYKNELIDGLLAGGADEYGERAEGSAELTVFTQDTFTDLCRGPHVPDTGKINPAAIKLLNVAGAYWRGDEKRPMLQRIYGTAWKSADDLEKYLWKLEEAKKRDHRLLGKQLDLYSTHEEIGAGLILWHPKGGIMRKLIEDHWGAEHEKDGYSFVYTPHVGKADLWVTSGHLENYAENMYSPIDIDGLKYYLKPMNCPMHIHIYKNQPRSYRDLPLRYSEKGTVYRYERSGVLHGLMRVRGFTQDDAHHFCRPDQVEAEIAFVLDFCARILRSFGFTEFQAYLSTKPAKSVGRQEDWDMAEAVLEETLKKYGMPYEVDAGGGAFYGPKIDLKIKDAIGREWQLSTIQFDFNLPERFGMTYVGEDGKEYQPYMVHRALLGSMERFFGVLIEHYAGAFPVWLCPVQVMIIPIADRHIPYAQELAQQIKAAGVRVEVDNSSNRMNKKIRNAQEQKIPYMAIVGDKEIEQQALSLRLRTEEDLGSVPVADFLARLRRVIDEKAGL
ncbi:MAG: threonine--tRNA ligase [Chloroflexi bacterium]|nr:threonine--tRNA ligase [Chloroflexota bacterium]